MAVSPNQNLSWPEGRSQAGWPVDMNLAGENSAVKNIELVHSRELDWNPDDLFAKAAEIYKKEGIATPDVDWADSGDLSIAFSGNDSRGQEAQDRALTLLSLHVNEKTGVKHKQEYNPKFTGTNNKPYIAFKESEYLGKLQGTNLGICINAWPLCDGHIQFTEIPEIGEKATVRWHNVAEYSADRHLAVLSELSKVNSDRGFIGYISGANTFAQFHMQAFPEKFNGRQLPIVDAVQNYLKNVDKFQGGYKELPIGDGINFPCYMYSQPDSAIQKLMDLAKEGYNCDLFTVQGKILLCPVDASMPNIIDPASNKSINQALKEPLGNIELKLNRQDFGMAFRPTLEKIGLIIQNRPSQELLDKYGISEGDFIRNYWEQVKDLFPKELGKEV